MQNNGNIGGHLCHLREILVETQGDKQGGGLNAEVNKERAKG